MSVKESIVIALISLRMNKMRSALTLLGVIIGIAAVISILTLGSALQTQFKADLEKAGANNFSVTVQERPDPGETAVVDPMLAGSSPVTDVSSFITPQMMDQIRAAMGDSITAIVVGEWSSRLGDFTTESEETSNGFLQLTNPDYISSSDYKILAGRSMNQEDIDSARPVAVLSTELATKLYGPDPADAIGEQLDFESNDGKYLSLNVIGVYVPPSNSVAFGPMPTDFALVPYPLEADISTNAGAGEAFTTISVRADPNLDKKFVGDQLQSVMDSLYQDDPDNHATVSDFSKELAQFNNMVQIMSLVIAAIGGISLLVGGIGVMNIMLITVTERTREIGVRKALGARRKDIRIQFVIEAIIVCLIGGFIGVLFGSVFGMVGASLLGNFVYPPISAVLVSLLFSVAIGLFFGYYPANRAAKLDPIEALRHE